jgi:tetratricopeptide (TPR) repeat protein
VNLLLFIGSTVALVLLILHSGRTRGRFITLAFFLSAFAFGILRGNAIWLLGKLAGGTDEALMPYLPQGGFLPDIGYSSIQVAAGWVFAMYLAWTVAELILRRIPALAGRVFLIAGLASLFMVAICWCMETTAVAVGWWYWSLPTRTALFGNVNSWAMEGWFSVVPDFLIPFLVIVCSERKGDRPANRVKGTAPFSLRWLWLLVFPAHILGHLWGHLLPQTFGYAVYNAMELGVVALAVFSKLRMSRGEIANRSSLAGVALAVFFGVEVAANVWGKVGLAGQMTLAPMLLLCLLAWGRLPAWGVAGLAAAVAAAGGAVGGARSLWALAPVGAFAFLALLDRCRERLWLKVAPVVLAAGLIAAAMVVDHADSVRMGHYRDAWVKGDALVFASKPAEAAEAYKRASEFRPRSALHLNALLDQMMAMDLDVRGQMFLYQSRLPFMAREMEEVIRRDPEWLQPRQSLARMFLLMGRVPDAVRQYRELSRFRPGDASVSAELGYLLLRERDLDGAEKALVDATRPAKASPAALVDLGVVRFLRGREDEARRLWERALQHSPGMSLARLNIDRIKTPSTGVDMRFLAQPDAVKGLAPWANAFAAVGRLSAAEKRRVYLEASQYDPDYLPPQINLAASYLNKDEAGMYDAERALWHARRANELSKTLEDRARRAQALLFLGRALLANGKPAEAREAFNQGRSIAPDELIPKFDQYRLSSAGQ